MGGIPQYDVALSVLGNAAAALATSVTACGVPQVTARLDALAGALTWAYVNMTGVDDAAKVSHGVVCVCVCV